MLYTCLQCLCSCTDQTRQSSPTTRMLHTQTHNYPSIVQLSQLLLSAAAATPTPTPSSPAQWLCLSFLGCTYGTNPYCLYTAIPSPCVVPCCAPLLAVRCDAGTPSQPTSTAPPPFSPQPLPQTRPNTAPALPPAIAFQLHHSACQPSSCCMTPAAATHPGRALRTPAPGTMHSCCFPAPHWTGAHPKWSGVCAPCSIVKAARGSAVDCLGTVFTSPRWP